MRRITVFADEEQAKRLTAVLENNGYDYMAEDYAEPTILRRPPPAIRPMPERTEPTPGMLIPLRKPVLKKEAEPEQKKPGRQPGKVRLWIERILRDQGEDDYDGIMKLAAAERMNLKTVRDTLTRAVKSGAIVVRGDVYRLPRT